MDFAVIADFDLSHEILSAQNIYHPRNLIPEKHVEKYPENKSRWQKLDNDISDFLCVLSLKIKQKEYKM